MKKLRITVEGKAYEVLVEMLDEHQAPPVTVAHRAPLASAPVSAPPASSGGSAAAAGPGDVVSPLAGRIVSLDVKIGDSVEPGTRLITIEAMKMNTYVNSQAAGKVTAILVNPGDAVEENQPLVTIG